MSGTPASEAQHAPAVNNGDGSPMVTVTQSVPCEGCGRSVLVALTPLHPPSFLHVDEQVECPEIQERRGRKGEGGLLLMMSGALKRSLDTVCQSVKVDAAAEGGRWLVAFSVPGVSSAHYSPQEARGLADVWQAHGHATVATGLRAAAAKAERQQAGRARIVAGVAAMV